MQLIDGERVRYGPYIGSMHVVRRHLGMALVPGSARTQQPEGSKRNEDQCPPEVDSSRRLEEDPGQKDDGSRNATKGMMRYR